MIRQFTLFATAFATMTSVASAATLYAGPIRVGTNGQILCELLNVGSKDLAGVEIRAVVGSLVETSVSNVQPGATFVESRGNSGLNSAPGWCEFTFKGGKRSVRATACARDVSATANCDSVLRAE